MSSNGGFDDTGSTTDAEEAEMLDDTTPPELAEAIAFVAFVAWANDQGIDLIELIRKEEPQRHHVAYDDSVTRPQHCDTCAIDDCDECKAGKWARYANRVRFALDSGHLSAPVRNEIDNVEFNWDLSESCTCYTCFICGLPLISKFLYCEKMVRAAVYSGGVVLELRALQQPGLGAPSPASVGLRRASQGPV
eukprot:scaffold22818_cov141-Isochrysis_galbana.AAC.1